MASDDTQYVSSKFLRSFSTAAVDKARIATKFKGPVLFTSESSISSTMGLKFRVGCGFVTVICYIFFFVSHFFPSLWYNVKN